MIEDWTPLPEELSLLKHDYRLVSRSYERLKDLSEEHQLEVPVGHDLKQICEISLAKSVVHSIVQFEGKERNQILALTDSDERSSIEIAIEQMIRDGIITENDGIISLNDH